MKQQWLQLINLNNGGTYYFHPQTAYSTSSSLNYATINSTESAVQIVVGDAGTITNLRVDILGSAPGSGKSWTVTVRKNGADQSLAVTLADSTTSGTDTDRITVAAGDKISIKTTSSGTPTNDVASISIEYDTNTTGYSMVSGGFENVAGTRYAPFAVYSTVGATSYESNFKAGVSPMDFTIRSIYVNLVTAPGAGKERGITIRRDASTLATLNVTDTDTEASSTGLSISVSADDNLNTVLNVVSGPDASILRYSVLIEAGTNGESWLSPGFGEWIDAGGPSYPGINHGAIVSMASTERSVYSGPSGFILKKLYQESKTLSATDSRTATVRKNGANTSITCIIAGSTGSANDTSNTATYDEGDYASLSVTSPGVSAAENEFGCISLCQYIPPSAPKGLPILYAG